MEQFGEYFAVLAPSIGVFLIFWFIYRAITSADALERKAEAEAREAAARREAETEDKKILSKEKE